MDEGDVTERSAPLAERGGHGQGRAAPDPDGLKHRPVLRFVVTASGVLFSVLALIGVVLPLVPATPFLLLAAACFARSSPRLHRWMSSNRWFGKYLGQWERERTVPRRAKIKAYCLVVATFSVSFVLVERTWQRVVLLAVLCAMVAFLAWLPTESRKR